MVASTTLAATRLAEISVLLVFETSSVSISWSLSRIVSWLLSASSDRILVCRAWSSS